ncbi:MAG: hypothetical protein ACMXYK_02155 [Candidatus Woesearchaeota archaeon]
MNGVYNSKKPQVAGTKPVDTPTSDYASSDRHNVFSYHSQDSGFTIKPFENLEYANFANNKGPKPNVTARHNEAFGATIEDVVFNSSAPDDNKQLIADAISGKLRDSLRGSGTFMYEHNGNKYNTNTYKGRLELAEALGYAFDSKQDATNLYNAINDNAYLNKNYGRKNSVKKDLVSKVRDATDRKKRDLAWQEYGAVQNEVKQKQIDRSYMQSNDQKNGSLEKRDRILSKDDTWSQSTHPDYTSDEIAAYEETLPTVQRSSIHAGAYNDEKEYIPEQTQLTNPIKKRGLLSKRPPQYLDDDLPQRIPRLARLSGVAKKTIPEKASDGVSKESQSASAYAKSAVQRPLTESIATYEENKNYGVKLSLDNICKSVSSKIDNNLDSYTDEEISPKRSNISDLFRPDDSPYGPVPMKVVKRKSNIKQNLLKVAALVTIGFGINQIYSNTKESMRANPHEVAALNQQLQRETMVAPTRSSPSTSSSSNQKVSENSQRTVISSGMSSSEEILSHMPDISFARLENTTTLPAHAVRELVQGTVAPRNTPEDVTDYIDEEPIMTFPEDFFFGEVVPLSSQNIGFDDIFEPASFVDENAPCAQEFLRGLYDTVSNVVTEQPQFASYALHLNSKIDDAMKTVLTEIANNSETRMTSGELSNRLISLEQTVNSFSRNATLTPAEITIRIKESFENNDDASVEFYRNLLEATKQQDTAHLER